MQIIIILFSESKMIFQRKENIYKILLGKDFLSQKKSLEVFYIHRKIPVWESIFNKVAVRRHAVFLKLVFSCEFCETFKNAYFAEQL